MVGLIAGHTKKNRKYFTYVVSLWIARSVFVEGFVLIRSSVGIKRNRKYKAPFPTTRCGAYGILLTPTGIPWWALMVVLLLRIGNNLHNIGNFYPHIGKLTIFAPCHKRIYSIKTIQIDDYFPILRDINVLL